MNQKRVEPRDGRGKPVPGLPERGSAERSPGDPLSELSFLFSLVLRSSRATHPQVTAALRRIEARNENLAFIAKAGAAVWNDWRKTHPECTLDLSHLDLRGTNLRGANLSGLRLSGTNLEGTDLRSANLTGSDLSKANLSRADMREALLKDADLQGALLKKADLSGAKGEGANFSDCDLSDANLREARFRTANFSNAQMKEATLLSSVFDEANFYYADLTDANLVRCSMKGANLVQACLVDALLEQTDLTSADLSYAAICQDLLQAAFFEPLAKRKWRLSWEEIVVHRPLAGRPVAPAALVGGTVVRQLESRGQQADSWTSPDGYQVCRAVPNSPQPS